jgi:hypothetical protein
MILLHYLHFLAVKVIHIGWDQELPTTEEIENIMKEILPMFYSSVKLKSLPGNYDIAQQNTVWIFRNLTNIFFIIVNSFNTLIKVHI